MAVDGCLPAAQMAELRPRQMTFHGRLPTSCPMLSENPRRAEIFDPAMRRNIEWRTATAADMPFLLSPRKLTTTEHLQRVALPTDDDAHHQRIASNFEDAGILSDGEVRIGLLKLSRTGDAWRLHQIQILPGHQGNEIGAAVLSRVLDEATRRRDRFPVRDSRQSGAASLRAARLRMRDGNVTRCRAAVASMTDER